MRTITVETGRPVTKPDMIDRLFRERLEALNDPLDPGFGFDLIRLSAGRTEIVVQQQRDLDAHIHDNDELSALIDRIAARIGENAWSCICRRIPISRSARCLRHPPSIIWPPRRRPRGPSARKAEPPLRPLRLFEKPEPIKVPFATVPDGPPHHFTWRRVTHQVVRVEGPERIATEWWKQGGETLTRDYFRIEDDGAAASGSFAMAFTIASLSTRRASPRPPTGIVHGLFA